MTAPEVSPAQPAHRGEAARALANVESSSDVTVDRYLYPTTTGDRDDRQNWADVYLPPGEHEKNSVPLVVLIHGGGWESKLGADVFVSLSKRLAERGLAVYNLEYRRVGSGGGWPTTFKDVAAALDFVPHVQSALPEISLHNAIVVGHSAGGQLAMWSGTRHNLEPDEIGASPVFRPTYAISLAGTLDMRQAVLNGNPRARRVMGGLPSEVPSHYTSVSPIENIDPDMPIIAMTGTADTVVPPSMSSNYVKAVKKAGGRGALVTFPGVDHTRIVAPDAETFPQIIETISRAAHDAHED
ncbi:alpha/beta fold hydrolase [Gordonia hydrophobica]|uniref:Alpha/beta fold hydrolase n=2 Tax=Gordonia hydrophobica TaxID=40516 RepID=A0ABZ2U4U7_9ACTN|nr:alpha/beta fold hydrolase [Gordonia hydrophobica]MBM7369515.1 acetyl esterase/lipase [Gordonia hydrophobica]